MYSALYTYRQNQKLRLNIPVIKFNSFSRLGRQYQLQGQQTADVKLDLWLANNLPEVKKNFLISVPDIYQQKCKKIYPRATTLSINKLGLRRAELSKARICLEVLKVNNSYRWLHIIWKSLSVFGLVSEILIGLANEKKIVSWIWILQGLMKPFMHVIILE